MASRILLCALLSVLWFSGASTAGEKLKALIVEGQNNHGNWPQTSQMWKRYLEQTDMFTADIVRTAPKGTDENFKPDFKKYDVVLSNYNGAPWPQATQDAFVKYVRGGGGFVVIHAADNSFGNWIEYNQIIGLGGWGGRNEKSGPYVYYNEDGTLVRDDSKGGGGHHGAQHPFLIVVRDGQHPITRGMPQTWMHAQDELYDKLRGPAENMHVLATAFATPKKGGSGRHEPMIFTVQFGEGRVFHTPMGHGNNSQECAGFIATLQRGSEWAATGKVTQKLPDDFPNSEDVSQRKFEK